MIYHRLVSFFGVVIVTLWGQAAAAASVSLVPESSIVVPNETFTVDLFLDANDVNGISPGNFSGQVTIAYDPGLLTLISSSGALVEMTGGSQGNMSFGFGNVVFNVDPDEGVVGTFVFQANGTLDVADIAAIGVDDGFGLMSFANNAGGRLNEFFPAFNGTSVTVQAVPLPAAAWLFISGLGALGLFGRKSRAANQIA